ncbi:MAG: rod shape-determining protein RodA [Pseudomonadota bacterium]|jgi:rod shape determining protein RodA
MLIDRRTISQFDWGLFLIVVLISLVGLVNLFSAGFDPDTAYRLFPWLPIEMHSHAFGRQMFFLGVGFVVLFITLAIPSQVLHRYAYIFYGVCVVLLAAVLLIGIEVNGSRRWLSFGGVNLQPAEPMKLGLILALGRYLARNPPLRGGYTLRQLLIPLGMVGVPMALIINQPDLGSALSVGIVGGAMILFMGVRPRLLVLGVVLMLVIAYPAWHSLHPYQQRRVLTLFNPDADPRGSGYHIIQSKIAVGSGGLTGKGYLSGTQTQLEFLPEHTTDFVFSVVAEEWGFFGCVAVLLMYVFLIHRLLKVVARSKDLFGGIITVGVTAVLFFHTIINVGMVIGLLPVVGIPLPLLSHGGSSIVSAMVGLGIALGVSMRRYLFSPRGIV